MNAINETHRWNLADLYPDRAAWDAEAAALETAFAALAAHAGRLGDGGERLCELLDQQADATRRLYRLALYAYQQLAEDTGEPASLALTQRVELLFSRLNQACAYIDPEILALGADRIAAMQAATPRLAIHAFPLARTLRAAAHTHDAAGERLIAQLGLMRDAAEAAYGIFSDADMPWPTLTLPGGDQVVLDQTAYTRHRESADRDVRRQAMSQFFATWQRFERTLGVLLHAQMRQDKAYADVRRYPDSITMVLDRDHTPVAVIDTLIAETQAGLPTLHRYFRLRARLLKLDRLHYHDIYVPLVQDERKIPIERAQQLALDSVAPLGADYVAAMRHGFASRWMDVYPRPRKQSGAHMAGYAYDVHPYVLMNYSDDYSSLTTLAHEWGHAMHSHLANAAQPFVTSQYATFTAEIASTFNEELLREHMLKHAADDGERLAILGHALESMRGTYFRQSMLAEFERIAHATVDRGEPLTGAGYTAIYRDLLARYHGDAVEIDPAYAIEWAYIPHFYSAFYVYQYATSIAAASLFADRVTAGEPGALDRYLGLLRAGGSGDPYELVKAAGVDLATPAPYRSLIARMDRVMDEIEALLAK